MYFLLIGVWAALLYLFVKCSPKYRRWHADDKVIVITGASGGIGAQLARIYATHGAHLVLAARGESELQKLCEDCRKLGARSVLMKTTDVTKENDCKELMEAVEKKYTALDCLILNAGVSMGELFEDVEDLSIYKQLMDVNYFGSLYCTKYALPHLKASNRPKIVVISSGAGKLGIPFKTGYCASKFALHGFFEALRCEIERKYGIAITMICPGTVHTNMHRNLLGDNPLTLGKENAMSVEQACDLMVNAIARGLQEYYLTWDQWIAVRLKEWAPELIQRLTIRKINKMGIRRDDLEAETQSKATKRRQQKSRQ